MLSAASKPFLLSVVMFYVFMQSVVAPVEKASVFVTVCHFLMGLHSKGNSDLAHKY